MPFGNKSQKEKLQEVIRHDDIQTNFFGNDFLARIEQLIPKR
jgi:hypothetical protein